MEESDMDIDLDIKIKVSHPITETEMIVESETVVDGSTSQMLSITPSLAPQPLSPSSPSPPPQSSSSLFESSPLFLVEQLGLRPRLARIGVKKTAPIIFTPGELKQRISSILNSCDFHEEGKWLNELRVLSKIAVEQSMMRGRAKILREPPPPVDMQKDCGRCCVPMDKRAAGAGQKNSASGTPVALVGDRTIDVLLFAIMDDDEFCANRESYDTVKESIRILFREVLPLIQFDLRFRKMQDDDEKVYYLCFIIQSIFSSLVHADTISLIQKIVRSDAKDEQRTPKAGWDEVGEANDDEVDEGRGATTVTKKGKIDMPLEELAQTFKNCSRNFENLTQVTEEQLRPIVILATLVNIEFYNGSRAVRELFRTVATRILRQIGEFGHLIQWSQTTPGRKCKFVFAIVSLIANTLFQFYLRQFSNVQNIVCLEKVPMKNLVAFAAPDNTLPLWLSGNIRGNENVQSTEIITTVKTETLLTPNNHVDGANNGGGGVSDTADASSKPLSIEEMAEFRLDKSYDSEEEDDDFIVNDEVEDDEEKNKRKKSKKKKHHSHHHHRSHSDEHHRRNHHYHQEKHGKRRKKKNEKIVNSSSSSSSSSSSASSRSSDSDSSLAHSSSIPPSRTDSLTNSPQK